MRVLVLGMHRSGTSAYAQLLELLGCHMGNISVTNQHWEQVEVKRINDALLRQVGCTWRLVDPQVIAAACSATAPELNLDARAVVAALDARLPWALKDPRHCVTLPFWHRFVEDPVHVLVYRHPLETAQSLKARDGLPLFAGCALWEASTRSALYHTQGRKRLLVNYYDLLQDPLGTASRLCEELLRLGVQGISTDRRDEIVGLVDLGRYRQRADSATRDDFLTGRQRELAAPLARGELPMVQEEDLGADFVLEALQVPEELQNERAERHSWRAECRKSMRPPTFLSFLRSWRRSET